LNSYALQMKNRETVWNTMKIHLSVSCQRLIVTGN